jgi:hypothetical protein
MRHYVVLTVLFCVFIIATSCSSYLSFDVNQGYDNYMETPKAVTVGNKAEAGKIAISLIAPKECACYLEKANQKKKITQDVPYQCLGFTITSDDPGKEIDQRVKQDQATAYQFYVFNGFSDVAGKCLDKHLHAYFKDVQIDSKSMNELDAVSESSWMDYYTKQMKTSDKYVLVKLIALSDQGNMLYGEGLATDKMGNGHLAWMIPLGVATFPIGVIIGAIIFDNSYNAHMNKVVAEAIDVAAADLSIKIADAMAVNPNQQFKVYVMLE